MHRQISQKTAKHQTITITIRDNNDPILPDIKEHLFESFNSTSGSGLGLYICKKIVELHGGSIVHHYVQPVGNKFVITLTFQTCEDVTKQNSKNISEYENSSDRSEINEIGIENESGKHKSSVLLVDDSLLNRKMMNKLLRKINIFKHIYTASDGEQAVKKMEHADNNIRTIFLDKYMPLMDGIQTAIQLRLLGYNNLIFGLTGDVNREDSDIFLKSGVDYIVIKPMDDKKLAMITNFIVTHGTCRQENRSIREINGELAWV
jgi:CheY-like chemotaxis protein